MLIVVAIIFIFTLVHFLTVESEIGLAQVTKKTGISFPSGSVLLFYKSDGILSDWTFLKVRIQKESWSLFIEQPAFREEKLIVRQDSVFSKFKDRYDGWEPQRVEKSISGILIMEKDLNKEHPSHVSYLFDMNDFSVVDCYFLIGV